MSVNELKRLGGDILGDQTARKVDDGRAETSTRKRGEQRVADSERHRKKGKHAVRSDDEVRCDCLLSFV